MSIKLEDVLQIEDQDQYKIHLASWNKEAHPLDVFVEDRSAWRNKPNEFNRKYIFSLIEFYHNPGFWLFGGIFEVLGRQEKYYQHSYEIQLTERGKEFIGRLKVRFIRPGRPRSFKLEKYYSTIYVSEVFEKEYGGEAFCGYQHICHDFNFLETIFNSNKSDWKAALENIKGVYLITDKSNGKKYVGSAYGDSGIWARWGYYMATGHGGNIELKRLIKRKGIGYAHENFKFSLLEVMVMSTPDDDVLARESHWKRALLTREHGYNTT